MQREILSELFEAHGLCVLVEAHQLHNTLLRLYNNDMFFFSYLSENIAENFYKKSTTNFTIRSWVCNKDTLFSSCLSENAQESCLIFRKILEEEEKETREYISYHFACGHVLTQSHKLLLSHTPKGHMKV